MAFSVPNQNRMRHGRMGTNDQAGNNGVFIVESVVKPTRELVIIASDGAGWEHASVHVEQRNVGTLTPYWEEMCQIKDLFWGPEDVVMQLHPAKENYVNVHSHTLHLWRPAGIKIPLPPLLLV
jgi:hypothetical protein